MSHYETITPEQEIQIGEDPTAPQILKSFATALEKRRAQGKTMVVTRAPYQAAVTRYIGGGYSYSDRPQGGNIKARVLIDDEDWRGIYRGPDWSFERVK